MRSPRGQRETRPARTSLGGGGSRALRAHRPEIPPRPPVPEPTPLPPPSSTGSLLAWPPPPALLPNPPNVLGRVLRPALERSGLLVPPAHRQGPPRRRRRSRRCSCAPRGRHFAPPCWSLPRERLSASRARCGRACPFRFPSPQRTPSCLPYGAINIRKCFQGHSHLYSGPISLRFHPPYLLP